MSEMQSEIDVATGNEIDCKILSDGDTKVKFFKVKLKDISTILKMGRVVVASIGKAKQEAAENAKKSGEITTVEQVDALQFGQNGLIIDMLDEHFDSVVKVASILCDMEENDIRELELDDAVTVMSGVIEVNKRFFTERVVPSLGPTVKTALEGILQSAPKESEAKS
jgi:hypothetical protein